MITITYIVHKYAGTNEDRTITLDKTNEAYYPVLALAYGHSLPHKNDEYGITIIEAKELDKEQHEHNL